MTHLDNLIADALAQSPDTVVHQLATDRERLRGELEAARAEIADLKRGGVDAAELDAISDAIRCIGNDAHLVSTGPFVHDALWVIGNRAYDVCARIDALRTIPADRVLGDENQFGVGFVEACGILAAKPFDRPALAAGLIREGGTISALAETTSDGPGISILREEMRADLDALRANQGSANGN